MMGCTLGAYRRTAPSFFCRPGFRSKRKGLEAGPELVEQQLQEVWYHEGTAELRDKRTEIARYVTVALRMRMRQMVCHRRNTPTLFHPPPS